MSAKLHHGAVAFVSIDNEDILLLRAGEILAAEGGRLKGLCLADSGDFELSFEVPESGARTDDLEEAGTDRIGCFLMIVHDQAGDTLTGAIEDVCEHDNLALTITSKRALTEDELTCSARRLPTWTMSARLNSKSTWKSSDRDLSACALRGAARNAMTTDQPHE
jgi:hypothetical protein